MGASKKWLNASPVRLRDDLLKNGEFIDIKVSTFIQMSFWQYGFWIRIFGRGFYLVVDNGLRLYSDRHGPFHKRAHSCCGLKFKLFGKE